MLEITLGKYEFDSMRKVYQRGNRENEVVIRGKKMKREIVATNLNASRSPWTTSPQIDQMSQKSSL